MKYAISLLFSFLCLAEVKGEDINPDAQTILVTEGDSISYPLDAEPVEVSALKNLFYTCTIMPGDIFEISSFTNYDDGTSGINIKKIEGAPGDQEVCHRGSSTSILGIHQRIKTKEGFPQSVTKIFYPFVFRPYVLEGAQIRKNYEREAQPSSVETILLKEGDTITYPISAPAVIIGGVLIRSYSTTTPKPPRFTVSDKNIDFNCVVAPGDSFKIRGVVNYRKGGARVSLKKTGGEEGNEEVCPLGTQIYNDEIENCKLVRTETGVPSAIRCGISWDNIFFQKEEKEEQEEEQGFLERGKIFFKNLF